MKKIIIWIDELNLVDHSQDYVQLTTVTRGNPWHAMGKLLKRYERNSSSCAYSIDTARFELMEEN